MSQYEGLGNIDSSAFEEFEKKLTEYIKNRPVQERWADFLQFSSNTVLVDLIAAGMAFNGYESKVALREAFLHLSTRLSSKIGVSETLGYSVNRGKNRRLRLEIQPSVSVSLGNLALVGSCKEADIVLLSQQLLTRDQITTIDVTVGRLFEEELVYSSDKPTRMRFQSEDVSEDIVLSLNGTEQDYSKEVLELVDSKFVMLTNHLKSVDVFHLNLNEFIRPKDLLKIRYVRREDLIYNSDDLKFDYGKILSITELSRYEDMESLERIEVNAPVGHEVQKVIRGRRDYHKFLRELDSSIIDSNYRDVSPAVIEVCYLREDETFFSKLKKQELLQGLLKHRPFGVEPPKDLLDPIEVRIPLLVTVTLVDNTISPSLTDDVNNILESWQNVLAKDLSFKDIEKAIESSLSYIKIARISIDYADWSDKVFNENSIVKVNDSYFICSVLHKTGETEPIWPDEKDVLVEDNQVVWKSYLAFQPVEDWTPNKAVNLRDCVKKADSGTSTSIYFECDTMINKSSSEEPDWDLSIGSLNQDNQILWKVEKGNEDSLEKEWEPNKQTNIGDEISLIGNTFKGVCVGFCGRGLGPEPNWDFTESSLTEDGGLVWKCLGTKVNLLKLDWNEYFKIDARITLESD